MSATAAAAAASCSPVVVVHGLISGRTLPDGLTAHHLARHKPTQQRLSDPSCLDPSKGPLVYRPQRPFLSVEEAIPNQQPPDPITTTLASNSIDNSCSSLSLFLYPETLPSTMTMVESANTSSSSRTVTFDMDRNSHEAIRITLKRLEIKVLQHLYPQRKKDQNSSKANNNDKSRQRRNDSLLPNYSIWNLKDNNAVGSHDHLLTWDAPWDDSLLDTTTLDTLIEQATRQPLAVRLSVPMIAPVGETQKHDEADFTMNLLLEANQPKLTEVHTFGEFGAHVFVGIPLVVSTKHSFGDKDGSSHVDWYSTSCTNETATTTLVQGSGSSCYIPTINDLGKRISVVITPPGGKSSKPNNSDSNAEAYRFDQPVEGRPENVLLNLRKEFLRHTDKEENDDRTFRIVTYNILSDQMLSEGDCYDYVPKQFLDKKQRLPRILDELLSYRADVLCLQEVDRQTFTKLLQPALTHFGYQGMFTCKQAEGASEGCAMFWNLKLFGRIEEEKLGQYGYAIRDLVPIRNDQRSNRDEWEPCQLILDLLQNRSDVSETLKLLGHVVQLVPLRLNGTDQTIVVGNTHLFFHPNASHIRVIQALAIARQAERVVGDYNGAFVMCGDLNSGLMNAGGELLSKRSVTRNSKRLQVDLNNYRYDGKHEELLPTVKGENDKASSAVDNWNDFPALTIPQSFPTLVSALPKYPPVTHFVPNFVGTLDHILMDSATFELVRSAPMPTLEDLNQDTGMPSSKLPSDHVSVVADLRLSG